MVEAVLAEIGADELPVVRALNKIDLLPPARAAAGAEPDAVPVSARTGAGMPRAPRHIETRARRAGSSASAARCRRPAAT